jgi:2-keto-4-pentenoate hydratase/2-oxohepta-3-ene-1,7-dioic acid hydratase in catechol pathway
MVKCEYKSKAEGNTGMQICRASYQNETFYGVIENNFIKRLISEPYNELKYDGRQYELAAVRLLAPSEPSKVVCVGLNYKGHAAEMKDDLPEEPKLFLKPSTAVIGPEDDILMPPQSARVDYEAELAIVIGRKCFNISEHEAMEYVFGYTCLNDVTARDLQKKDTQWTRAKSFDTFCPIGPWIETELCYNDAGITGRLNGVVKQSSCTSDLIFSVPQLVSFISGVMTLLPGDVIATGTPAGIGKMEAGDTIEVEIQGIGILRNHTRLR